MKINEIAALVRKQKVCVIATGARGKQWIGTWSALYPVDGVVLNQGSIPALLDLNEREQENILIQEIPLEDAGVYPKEKVTPNPMTEVGLELNLYGGVICLTDRGRAYLLEKRMIRPAVGGDQYRQYMLGEGRNGAPTIVIYDGLLYAGVAAPLAEGETEGVLRDLRKFCFLRAGGYHAGEEEATDEGEQMEMGAGE